MSACLQRLVALMGLVAANAAYAVPLAYNGTLDVVELDNGGGVYSGTPLGTSFSIGIGDLRPDGSFPSGSISGAGITTGFGCGIPTFVDPVDSEIRCSPLASGPSFSDNQTLDAGGAALLNSLFGAGTFSAGSQVDIFDVEGDAGTPDDRIEVGFTFIFDPGTYSGGPLFGDISPAFDPSLASRTLFFIFEEQGGNDIYSALGVATVATGPTPDPDPDPTPGPNPVPAPSTVFLLGSALLILLGERKRRSATFRSAAR